MSAVRRLEAGLARLFATPRLRIPAAAGVALLVLAGLLFRLGHAPVTRSAEERCFEVARHMTESGELLVPIMDGAPRLKKPPLYYWAAVGAAALLGGESRTALRLPSALSALGLLFAVFFWGRSRGGFAGGALAALCLLSMIEFWTLGRRGVAEMPLALFATLGLFAFDRIYWGRRRELLPWFFAAVWLAFLAKATAALLLVGLPVALRLTLDRAWRRTLRADVLAWAAVCGLGCLAWYVAVLLWVPGAPAVLRESLLLPLGLAEPAGSAAHVRPLWYFVPALFAAAAPAVALAALLPWQLRQPGAEPDAPRQGFPLLAFASLFVAFSLMPMKQKHYLLPLLPLLALSLAPALRAAYETRRDVLERAAGYLGWAFLVATPPVALLLALHLGIAGEGVLAATLVSACVLAAGALGFAAGRSGCLRAFGLAVAVLTLVPIGVHLTSFDPLRQSFKYGTAEQSVDLDAQRWARLFESHPALRAVYRAKEWQPPS